MAPDPRMRASDAERDQVAAALREHHAAGRLTVEEFQERLDEAYEAKTIGDLDQLMTDLPATDLYQLPAPAAQSPLRQPRPPVPHPVQTGRLSSTWRAAWGTWATASTITFVIWLVVAIQDPNEFTRPWFLWVAGPWGVLLLAGWMLGDSPHHRGRRRFREELREGRGELRDNLRAQRGELRRRGRSQRDL